MDSHPEKRMKAAWLEYEEENLEQLKKENPGMRLSQIKQIMKKNWQKSPKNPLNKIFLWQDLDGWICGAKQNKQTSL